VAIRGRLQNGDVFSFLQSFGGRFREILLITISILRGLKDSRPCTDFESPYHKYTEYVILVSNSVQCKSDNVQYEKLSSISYGLRFMSLVKTLLSQCLHPPRCKNQILGGIPVMDGRGGEVGRGGEE